MILDFNKQVYSCQDRGSQREYCVLKIAVLGIVVMAVL